MKKMISATSGRNTSTDYIKSVLFDYLMDDILIGGESASSVIARIQDLAPVFDVDDVINRSADEMIEIPEAISELEDELDTM